MSSVAKKTAIVTGGANGIGFECCRELLRGGAKIIAILDLPNSNGESATRTLNDEFGAGRALFFPSDVTNFDQLEVVFKNAVGALGSLDILINNAGMLNEVAWQKMIALNFVSAGVSVTWNTTALVKSTLLGYDYMGRHKGGKGGIILNMGSVAALTVEGPTPVYISTKHAVLAFTVSLKDSYERTGVSVRIMCPGVTDTTLITNVENKHLDIVDRAEAVKRQLGWTRQPKEHVAKSMIELIEKGANGAVWVSENGDPPIEIQMPKYETIKF